MLYQQNGKTFPLHGKVYITNYKSEADLIIYITNYKSEADLLFYMTSGKGKQLWPILSDTIQE